MAHPDLSAIELLRVPAETLLLGEPIVHVDERGEEQLYYPLCFEEETASEYYYMYSSQAGRFGEITVLMASLENQGIVRITEDYGTTRLLGQVLDELITANSSPMPPIPDGPDGEREQVLYTLDLRVYQNMNIILLSIIKFLAYRETYFLGCVSLDEVQLWDAFMRKAPQYLTIMGLTFALPLYQYGCLHFDLEWKVKRQRIVDKDAVVRNTAAGGMTQTFNALELGITTAEMA